MIDRAESEEIRLPTVRWAGSRFIPMHVEGACALLARLVAIRRPMHLHLCNSWTIALSERDETLAESIRDADALNLIDGVPLARSISGWSRRPVEVSRGPSLFAAGIQELAALNSRQFFLGGSTEVCRRVVAAARLAGAKAEGYSPPFEPLTEKSISAFAARIRDQRPDVVWVGLGTPKQDVVARRLSQELGVPTVCVGAAFDFYAGRVREAPPWLQGSGFEWLFRLSQDPRRLWRRYTFGNIAFVRIALTQPRATGGNEAI